MRKVGISALKPYPGTSRRNPQHKVFPYLLRKLAIKRSNQGWALDTIYIRMVRGFVYLMPVVDVNSRRILAHRVAITLEAVHAVETLQEAYARFGIPEIVHSDQGRQFTVHEFVDALIKHVVELPWPPAALEIFASLQSRPIAIIYRSLFAQNNSAASEVVTGQREVRLESQGIFNAKESQINK